MKTLSYDDTVSIFSKGKKRMQSFMHGFSSRFGNRNLEKEAAEISLKMEQGGIKGETVPDPQAKLSQEVLDLIEKDRTPG